MGKAKTTGLMLGAAAGLAAGAAIAYAATQAARSPMEKKVCGCIRSGRRMLGRWMALLGV